MRAFVPVLALALPAAALAVPHELPHQGRLLDSTGVPLDGAHEITFALYDQASGGSPLWSEVQDLTLDDGYFATSLGAVEPLALADFADGDPLWLGLTVGTDPELTPRVAVSSVPYALVAGEARVAASVAGGGPVEASSVSVGGVEVIASDGTVDFSRLTGVPVATDTLADLDCLGDDVARFDGASWVCAAASDHVHGADDLVQGTVAIARLPVGTGEGTVAAGNHLHDASSITSGTLAAGRIPFGDGTDQVARGDHEHDGVSGDFTVGGGLTVGDTSTPCDASTAGTIRWSGDGFQGCDGAAWVTFRAARNGVSATAAATSCKALHREFPDLGDGVYWLDPDGVAGVEPFRAFCDMTTDGGGWTLVGTISGADADNWNTQYGYWSDANLLGSVEAPWVDFKSPAWLHLDISDAEVLWQRRFDGQVRGRAILSNNCLHGKERFVDLFGTYQQSRCGTGQITVLQGDPEGVNAGYHEGGPDGLGGSGTNGWCWNGGDSHSNTFKGHAGWNQSGYACTDNGHLGYVGVFTNGSGQYENKDITGTNWLNGRPYDKVDVSFFVR